jgi:hypothetical protein
LEGVYIIFVELERRYLAKLKMIGGETEAENLQRINVKVSLRENERQSRGLENGERVNLLRGASIGRGSEYFVASRKLIPADPAKKPNFHFNCHFRSFTDGSVSPDLPRYVVSHKSRSFLVSLPETLRRSKWDPDQKPHKYRSCISRDKHFASWSS